MAFFIKQDENWYLRDTAIYRHELKYAITSADYLALRQRLRTVMKADPHEKPTNSPS